MNSKEKVEFIFAYLSENYGPSSDLYWPKLFQSAEQTSPKQMLESANNTLEGGRLFPIWKKNTMWTPPNFKRFQEDCFYNSEIFAHFSKMIASVCYKSFLDDDASTLNEADENTEKMKAFEVFKNNISFLRDPNLFLWKKINRAYSNPINLINEESMDEEILERRIIRQETIDGITSTVYELTTNNGIRYQGSIDGIIDESTLDEVSTADGIMYQGSIDEASMDEDFLYQNSIDEESMEEDSMEEDSMNKDIRYEATMYSAIFYIIEYYKNTKKEIPSFFVTTMTNQILFVHEENVNHTLSSLNYICLEELIKPLPVTTKAPDEIVPYLEFNRKAIIPTIERCLDDSFGLIISNLDALQQVSPLFPLFAEDNFSTSSLFLKLQCKLREQVYCALQPAVQISLEQDKYIYNVHNIPLNIPLEDINNNFKKGCAKVDKAFHGITS